MKQPKATYPVRLPRSVKAAVERRAKAEGISVNQFVAAAIGEKLAAIDTATFIAERRKRTDFRQWVSLKFLGSQITWHNARGSGL